MTLVVMGRDDTYKQNKKPFLELSILQRRWYIRIFEINTSIIYDVVICRELVEISPSFYLNIKLNHPYPTIFKFNLKIINDDFFNTYTVVCKFES